MKKIGSLVLLVVLVLTVGACSSKEEKLDKLVITYVTSPLNVPSIIENQNNILQDNFKANGTTVELAKIVSGADQTQALASGDVQILNCVGATSVVLAADKDNDIKIIKMYARSPKAFMIIAKDKNINSPQDLKGLKIGGPVGTNLHELLAAYLNMGNIELSDVNFMNMDLPSAKAALANGSIDVALLAGPDAYQVLKQGYHLVSDGQGLISAQTYLATTQDFYDNHKQAIDTFLNSQQQALAFMKEKPDETINIVAKDLDLPSTDVKAMIKQYNFNPEITSNDLEGLQKTADFMYQAKMIDKKIDVNDLIIK